MRRFVVLSAALPALVGCYVYRPATWETVPSGAEIRGVLSTEARIGLEDRLRQRIDHLSGRLVERQADTIVVEMRSLSAADGRPLYQRVSLAQRDVLRVDTKRLDKVRTAAFVAGVVTLALVSVATGFWSTGGDGGGGGGGNEAPPAPDPGRPYR